jgi:DNA-binding transcriptional ArsR family regulator
MPDDVPAFPPARSVENITDARTMRALAHPIRLALLSLLRTRGSLTATKAGELLGESSASASFHLRQLGKYGLAEEAGGGQGRERPWRATAMFTSVPEVTDNPDLAAASDVFRSMVAEHYFTRLRQWLRSRPGEPVEWQQAATQNDLLLYVTPGELTELTEQILSLVGRYTDRLTSPELRPAGSRLVQHIDLAFPIDKLPPRDPGRPEPRS